MRFSGAIEAAFGLTREVAFFYSPYDDLQIREIEAARQMMRKLPREVTPDIMFVWSADERARTKLHDWSSVGKTIVPLSSIDASDPVQLITLLRDFVYARDLFFESTPVRGDRFFGRRELLRGLYDDVRNQRVAGVFGLRKAGKTSVLAELGEQLESTDQIVLLRDLETLPSPPEDPIPSLVKDLASDMLEELETRKLSGRQLRHLLKDPDIGDFRRAMQSALIKLAAENTNVLLMLDEIEYLTPTDRMDTREGDLSSIAQFLGALRSLVQENPNFTFVLSGLTSAIVEEGRLYGRPNPLFSWAKAHFLAPFDEDEASELAESVGRRMGITIERGALGALFEATGGHAFLYRHLASRVVKGLPVEVFRRTVTRSDVLRALDPWKLEVSPNIEEMVNHVRRYYPIESLLLEALLEQQEIFDDLSHDAPVAVKRLLGLGLIVKNRDGYEPTPVLELL